MTDLSVVNTLAERAPPGPGHNQPPLAEQLVEEMADARARDDELIAVAGHSRIAGQDDAIKVTNLVALIRAQEKTLAIAHEARKKPFLEDGRTVDRAYKPEIERLLGARSALERMLTVWQRAREQEANIERQRLAAEQRQREEEAERAREAAEAAKAQGNGSIAAELAAIRAQEEADSLARRAETVRPDKLRTTLGAVNMRREISFTIVDEKKAIAWLYKNRKHELLQASRTILGSVLRSMGVDAAASAEIAGVEVSIESRAQVR